MDNNFVEMGELLSFTVEHGVNTATVRVYRADEIPPIATARVGLVESVQDIYDAVYKAVQGWAVLVDSSESEAVLSELEIWYYETII